MVFEAIGDVGLARLTKADKVRGDAMGHRRDKRAARLHLVDGLIIALLNIDEVIQVIRESDDAAAAKERLIAVFDLTEIQAQYILDTPLRRLTRFDKLELEREQETLRAEIAELTEILENDETLRALVGGEMADLAKKFGTPRRTVLMEAGAAVTAAVPLEVGDDPCQVVLSATGLLARVPVDVDDETERVVGSSGPATEIPEGTGAADLVACSVGRIAKPIGEQLTEIKNKNYTAIYPKINLATDPDADTQADGPLTQAITGAIADADTCRMTTVAALARRRSAELAGDPTTDADAALAARGIVDVPRFARVFMTWPVT